MNSANDKVEREWTYSYDRETVVYAIGDIFKKMGYEILSIDAKTGEIRTKYKRVSSIKRTKLAARASSAAAGNKTIVKLGRIVEVKNDFDEWERYLDPGSEKNKDYYYKCFLNISEQLGLDD